MTIAQVDLRDDVIDLGVGQPALSLLPTDIVRQGVEHRLRHDAAAYLQYGVEQGDGTFRDDLARFISSTHGITAHSDRLFVTSGASQALDLIATLFVPPGAVVCVEEPSYHLALNILRDHRFRLVGLPTDEHGLIVDGLEDRLAELSPAMLYLIPTFQNPTGTTLSLERRERLVELSRRHDLLLVADEVYHCLGYDEVPPPSFGRFVEEARVMALGSFSKILAPGLRLGWIQADPKAVQRMVGSGLLDSGGGLNPFISGLVRSVLELDLLEPHLARLKATYRARLTVMSAALDRYLPDATYALPRGGYFFWPRLPDRLDATALLPYAESSGVGFRAGTLFASGSGLRDRLRLSFALYQEEQLAEGVRRLGEAVERFRSV